ncbi:MAG TPA: hypothetical protein VFD29_03490, partial [Gillisia sp.]|nr:hypothetical protein [Gillisia sp.]
MKVSLVERGKWRVHLISSAEICEIFYVVLQVSDHNFSLNLYYKPQEELSSAGEQLNSNRVYDGEYTGPFS